MFEGKAGIVTGGASGIGKAVVARLLREGAGVVAVDCDERMLETLDAPPRGDWLLPVVGDVADEVAAAGMVAKCLAHFGRIDFLANCAAVSITTKTLDEVPIEDFEQTLAVNLRGTFLTMRAAIGAMKVQGEGGAIVNIASLAGIKAVRNVSSYAASKYGVVGLTGVAALENAAAGIRVNVVCPGVVNTPMTRRRWGNSPDHPVRNIVPMGRVGHVDELANAIVWLLSDEASYVTGVTLPVDGGLAVG